MVGPYFQYCVPGGSTSGYTTCTATVPPIAQPDTVKSNSP